tara:strand:+ start:1564 stop:1800 length:237 start_codon:yes stop_codon:yes gene_type:complete
MPHRKSITIEKRNKSAPSRWVNVASTGTKAQQAAEAKAQPGFKTVEAAVAAAEKRSARAGNFKSTFKGRKKRKPATRG